MTQRRHLINLLAFGLFNAVNTLTMAQSSAPLGQMPVIQTETLGERKLTLPQDLPGEKTLAVIAFERGQQANINTWVNGLNLKTTTDPWVELPVIEPRSSWSRAFIDGGMRMGIRDEAMRNRVITLYIERAPFLKAMGLPESTKSIYVVIVTRSGQVLASVEGDYTPEKAAVLAKAFGQ
jgi:hypothetical protein